MLKFIATLLIASMLNVSLLSPAARASAMISTQRALAENASREQRERVTAFLGRSEVQRQLVQLGVDPQEAMSRVGSLSDAELRQIEERLDSLPAGQDGVGAVIGAVVLIFIILLITDILGFTKVFPFTRSVR